RMQNNFDDAEREYRESLGLAIELRSRTPSSNQAHQKILAMAYFRLGLIDELRNQPDEASVEYGRCTDLDVNPNSWTPRSIWPEDVHAACVEKFAQLKGRPRR